MWQHPDVNTAFFLKGTFLPKGAFTWRTGDEFHRFDADQFI